MTTIWRGDNQKGLPKTSVPNQVCNATSSSPLASKVLGDDGNKSLQRAKYSSVDHDGSGRRAVSLHLSRLVLSCAILEVEALRELEVELDRSTLERALEGVLDSDVDLRAVEGAVSRIKLPFARVEFVECAL
jgi:hypothetical protein